MAVKAALAQGIGWTPGKGTYSKPGRWTGFLRFLGLGFALCGAFLSSAEALAGPTLSNSKLFAGLVELQIDGRLNLPAWDDVHRLLDAQQKQVLNCRAGWTCGSKGAGVLAATLEQLSARDRQTQVIEVNRLINRLPYVEDSDKFGTGDKWQLPLDLFEGGGDCEDFAIAKYFVLRQLGIPDADLRIVVAQVSSNGMGHAFLAVVIDGRELILDYDVSKPSPQTAVPVRPRYAFNATNRWLFVPSRR